MPKPNICLVTLDYPPEPGGVARYLGSLVDAADGAIEVVVPRGHETHGPGEVMQGKMFWRLWPKWWPMISLIHKRRSLHQVILASQVFPVGTAAWISRLVGGPEYAVLFHGLDVRLARGAWKRFLMRSICCKAKVVFAVSESTQRMVKDIVPDIQVKVITPGVQAFPGMGKSEAREKLGIALHGEIALSVARLIPRKGIDVAIEAVASVQKDRVLTYVVIGDGPDAERLLGVAERTGAKVTWLGEVDEATKHAWLAAADVFVLPVRDTGDDVEGFGIVYLEAGMAGLPSIAGKSGGASEAVIDGVTGLVVDPSDVGKVSDALRQLLDDEDKRELLGAQARTRAKQDFHWSQRWEQFRSTLL